MTDRGRSNTSSVDYPLKGIRVLEVTQGATDLCGRILADLGAEVIKVEPPRGSEGRRQPPFAPAKDGQEDSFFFQYFNLGKKSIILDYSIPEYVRDLENLALDCDVMLLGPKLQDIEVGILSHSRLRQANPRLIVASMTGFGKDGPYCSYEAPDIVCYAAGGEMFTVGAPDRPPLAAPYDQAYQMAALTCAYGVLLALFDRERTGRSQDVEVSAQEVVASGLNALIANYSAACAVLTRRGDKTPVAGSSTAPFGLYRCKDGWINLVVIYPGHWNILLEHMGNPKQLQDSIWHSRHTRASRAAFVNGFVEQFTSTLKKDELYALLQKSGIPAAPLYNLREFAGYPQIQHRGFFVDVNHPQTGRLKVTRLPFQMSEATCQPQGPAPLLGQNTTEVLANVKDAKLSSGNGPQRQGPAHADSLRPPLAGIRVVDFTGAMAGPAMTRMLAEFGAEVIKVETVGHIQRPRVGKQVPHQIALQQVASFTEVNRNKKSITLNLGTPRGRDLAKQLIRMSDAVIDNFSGGTMNRWGLDYASLRKVKEDIIVASLSGYGSTGPHSTYHCGAIQSMALSGMYSLWDYNDSERPLGPATGHPDLATAIWGAIGFMAALFHRSRTGKGQFIDQAQIEVTACLIGPAMIKYLATGEEERPKGNSSPSAAPHGCFRCKGEDRWCVISVANDGEWERFCRAIGGPAWCKDPRFSQHAGRVLNVEALNLLVEDWTSARSPLQVMRTLQRERVPAAWVASAEDLYLDPQLRQRGFAHYLTILDDTVEIAGPMLRMSRGQATVQGAPEFGEHNDYVFNELLRLSPDEANRLKSEGVIA